jgi:glutamyl-tRNA synthetase
MGEVVGRLAPSPTGGLHVGHARTFLLAWLRARGAGGRVVLRIEDLDAGRVRSGMAEQAIADLRWLGLDWDEGPDLGGPHEPYIQSGRRHHYDRALARLIADDRVYPCTCTRAEIARMQSAPHAEDEGPLYPGTCAGRSAADAEALGRAGRPFAWRFRTPAGEAAWDDRQLGSTRRGLGGDFVVGRSTGEAAYQLAVVVDDAAMGVTEVVRGDDLVLSTPRQLALFEALGLRPPAYEHVPLVLDAAGRRLAKRDRAIKLAALRSGGLDRRRLVGFIIRSFDWVDEAVASDPRDWIGRAGSRVSGRPWRLEGDELGGGAGLEAV